MKPITCPNCKTVFEPIISNSRFSCPSCKTVFCLTQKPDGSWSAKIESRPVVQQQPPIIIQQQSQQPPDARAEDARNRRRDVLQNAIMGYTRKGYVVTSHTETSGQLELPKKLRWLFFLLTCWFIVGILYLIYFAVKRKKTDYLMVDSQGNLNNKAKSIGGVDSTLGKIVLWIFFPSYMIYLGIKWVLGRVKQDEAQRKWAKYIMFGFFPLWVIIAIIQIVINGLPA